MEQCKGLIAGIDIGYSKIQASVYSYNSRNVQTVKLTEDSKEKTSLVNVVAECMRATGTSQIQSICVTIPDYHSDEISAVRDTLKKCGVSDGRWQVLSRVESFAYYAYRQKSELHAAGVALFDYTSEGIRCDYLAVRKNDNSNYLLQEHTGYTSDILKKAVISKELGLAENELCTFAEEYFSKRHVSAAYLTGEGFDVEKLPERFAKLMVTRRKAFVGQNLFAKGACFAAMEILKPEVFKNVIMLLDNHVKCGIEIDISSYEKPMRFRLVRPGSNWYTAGRTVECILEDMRSITFKIITPENKYYDEVVDKFDAMMDWLADLYVNTLNLIQYMHDKYYYEKAQMAFVDTDPRINLAYGVAGLSIAIDSLSAIKYAKVTARRNDIGLTEGFDIEGDFPCFGNNDDRVDHLGVDLVYYFSEELKKLPVYKNARPTLSLLTITSNVMYGKKTGATPDGRAKGVAFAPGANPMHGRDKNGAIASLSSVAKLRYRDSQDGISNTFSIVPKSLGPTAEERVENLVTMMDGYFTKGAHHLNVNVLNREMLEDAMEHPEKYPQLTIRVSGYAVNFVKLSREHQLEVISRSFHERM